MADNNEIPVLSKAEVEKKAIIEVHKNMKRHGFGSVTFVYNEHQVAYIETKGRFKVEEITIT